MHRTAASVPCLDLPDAERTRARAGRCAFAAQGPAPSMPGLARCIHSRARGISVARQLASGYVHDACWSWATRRTSCTRWRAKGSTSGCAMSPRCATASPMRNVAKSTGQERIGWRAGRAHAGATTPQPPMPSMASIACSPAMASPPPCCGGPCWDLPARCRRWRDCYGVALPDFDQALWSAWDVNRSSLSFPRASGGRCGWRPRHGTPAPGRHCRRLRRG